MATHAVVSRQEWLGARRAHLAKEKALTHQRDALERERLGLPWERVEKDYVFDSADGEKRLAELFGDKSQLLIYHFMFGPEWEQGCPSCSMTADSMDANAVHLAGHDVALVVVSRAPMGKIAAFQKRMGWKFPWVSSFGNDFNRDFRVSFTEDELKRKDVYNFGTSGSPGGEESHGFSAFSKGENGEVLHTYSSYGRGSEGAMAVYSMLEMTPKGRNEVGLPWPMAWVRLHDAYEPQTKAKAAECCGAHGD